MIKTLLEKISQINNSFINTLITKILSKMIMLKLEMALYFKNENRTNVSILSIVLSRLNEDVLSPNRFEQLTVEGDAKESANVEKYDDNSNNNPTRMTTKESNVSEANLNLNYSSRPRKIANNHF